MSLRLQVVIAIGAVLTFIYIAEQVRSGKLELKYALIWFLVDVLLLIFDLFPHLLNGLTSFLGITLPINMLTFLGLVFVLMIIFSQTIVISNLTRRCKRLIQEVGLLEKKLEDIEKKMEEK